MYGTRRPGRSNRVPPSRDFSNAPARAVIGTLGHWRALDRVHVRARLDRVRVRDARGVRACACACARFYSRVRALRYRRVGRSA